MPEGHEYDMLEDPVVKLAVHVIKQAVDDYRLGKSCRIKDRKKYNAVQSKALDAKKFLYESNGVAVWLRFARIDSLLDLRYLRQMTESSGHRAFNWHGRFRSLSNRVESIHE